MMEPMGCEDFEHLLPLAGDPLLTKAESSKLNHHLQVCPVCAQAARDFSRLAGWLRRIKTEAAVPPAFLTRLARRLDLEDQRRRRFWVFWAPLATSTAGATAVLLFLLVGPYLNPGANRASRHEVSLSRVSAPSVAARALPLLPEFPPVQSRHANYGQRSMSNLSQRVAFFPNAPAWPAYSAQLPEHARAWCGESSGIEKLQYRVARTSPELAQIWEEAKIAPAVTELAWEKQMLAAIFLGKRAGIGYEIFLLGVDQLEKKTVVRYRIRGPQTLSQLEEISQPFLLVMLPYSELPVEFIEQ